MKTDPGSLKRFQIYAPALLVLNNTLSMALFAPLARMALIVLALCIVNFLFVTILYIRQRIITRYDMLTTVYFLLLFLFTIINNTEIKYCLFAVIQVFLFMMMLNYFRRDLSIILKSSAAVFSFCIYLNLVAMVLFPSWMFTAKDSYSQFMLGGNYNQMGGRILPALVTCLLTANYGKLWKINSIATFVASIITLLIVGSMTSLSNILVFTLFCLIPIIFIRKVFIVGLFFVFLFFQVFIVFSGEGLHNNELAVYIIQDVLGKDITFTNRTHMWDAALKVIVKSPMIGYGFVDGPSNWYITNMDATAKGPHNFILSVLINGSVVLLSLYVLICSIAFKRIVSYKDNKKYSLLMGIVVYMFMMAMEVYPYFFVFYLLGLAYYYPDIARTWRQNPSPSTIQQEQEPCKTD